MELAAMDEELRASIEELAAIEEELRTSNEELMLQTMRLRESEERFRALSQTSPVGVGVSSADGVLVYTNPAYESILGYGSGELLGKNALDLYMYPEERTIWLEKMKGGDLVRDYELRLKRKDGTPVWVTINTSDIQYGGKLAVMGTIQDISARKKAEDALRAANDKLSASNEELATKEEELRASNEELSATEEELRASNEELRQQALRLRESEEALRGYSANLESMVKEQASRLLRSEHFNVVSSIGATIAHDLRNPLSRINQSIELARRNPDGAERMLEIAKESAQHALNMVEEFRQATTRIELKKLDVNLQTLVWESLGSVKIPEKVDLKVDVSSELGLVNVDPDLLQRVLVNLCVNAVEAMPEGGKLSVLANRDDDMVTIMVADTGVGMSPEVVERLWEPLFTTKSKGLGLGLYFVRNAVEAHGGSVELTTESGKGTTFTLKIPSG